MALRVYRIQGVPVPWQTPERAGRWGRGHAYRTPRVTAWQESIATQLRLQGAQEPSESPLRLTLAFRIPRPPSHYTRSGALSRRAPQWPTKRCGDLRNLGKAVEDGGTGILWVDDSQVQECHDTRRYCVSGEPPGVTITVEELRSAAEDL